MSFVYLVYDSVSCLTKIGHSTRPAGRFESLEREARNPLEQIALCQTKSARFHEHQLHALFAHARVKGEWFNLTLSDLEKAQDYLSSISSPYRDTSLANVGREAVCRFLGQRGLTQGEFAKQLSFSEVQLSRMMSGKSEGSVSAWREIFDKLGLEQFVKPKANA